MATEPPTSPPPRPMSGLVRPPRSISRMSSSSRRGDSRASDEEAKTSVKVAVRVRPPLQPHDPGFELIPQRFQRPMVHVTSSTGLAVDSPQGRKLFVFDRVFGEDILQDGIWEYVSESTNAFLQGYNVSVMAYGQSGAGKSFTMGTSGPSEQGDRQLMGIVPRAASAIFEHLNASSASARPASGIRQPNRMSMSSVPTPSHGRSSHSIDRSWQMKATYVEIYNEQLRDLLVPEHLAAHERPTVTIREDTKGRILLTGLHQVTINSIDDLLKALNFGSSIRQTDATTINAKSSRSHAVFSINLVQKRPKETSARIKRMSMPAESALPEDSITVDSKLHFVDLAGSERLKNTGASGERAKEGISINAGLASLGKVIAQLSARHTSGHISYRDSKLTRLLQDSLGGNAITYLVACVNPAEFHLSETLNTIQYAQRARNIQSKPKIQQVSDDSDKQALIDRLRAEVTFLRDQLRSAERSDRGPAQDSERSERSNEKEIELQNQLLDTQESYQALSQRHAKLMAEIAKAQKGTTDDLPTLNGVIGESAMERIQRSNSFSEAVEQVVLEYEKTIQSLESLLSSTRSTLASTESKLLERETKCAYVETINEQLQSRLQKFMERESSTEKYVRDLEANMDTKSTGEERNAATATELRKELSRLREKDNNSEEYISSLEERLAEADQGSDMLRSEISRLEHVIDRQRSVSKLDNLLHELDQKQTRSDEPQSNGALDSQSAATRHRGLSQATFKVAIETPIPESENEDAEFDEEPVPTPVKAPEPSTDSPASIRAAEQSKFMEEKLETVNHELFELRVEHETTVNDYAQLSAKYEEAMRALETMNAANADMTNKPALKSAARMKEIKAAGQVSSSRSLSSELSSAGERPASLTHSERSVQHDDGGDTAPSSDGSDYGDEEPELQANKSEDVAATRSSPEFEELHQLAAQKDEALQQLRNEYDDLNEKYLDRQDEIEELKAEVTKAKMSVPPSPTSQFLRRKSSQNVMSIDRAHRSLASLGNIASDRFAEDQDVKDQFELHINAIMHELHQRSERVTVLEGEIANVKKDMESKMAIISGLTRERTSMKAQSPVDMSMFTNMRDQVLQSEAQVSAIQQKSETREKELVDEIEALKRSIEIIDVQHRSMSSEAADSKDQKKDLQSMIDGLQHELVEWQQKHDASTAAIEQSEKQYRATISELEKTLNEVETVRQQVAAERDSQANSLASTSAALEEDRQRHSEAVTAMRSEIETKKAVIDSHVSKIAELERDYANAQRTSTQFKQETQASLESHREQIQELVKQLSQHQSAVETYKHDLKSVRDSHLAELEEVRNSANKLHREATENRIAELSAQYNDQMTKLRGEIEDLEETLSQQKGQLEERGARISKLEFENPHTRNISEASEGTQVLQERIRTAEDHKSEAERALKQARAKLEELNQAKEEMAKELVNVREREQRASRLVEELEGQLASQFEEGQEASSRLSLMQSNKDQELADARAAALKAQEEIGVLNKRLSQLESQRGSMQSTSEQQSGDRSSSMSTTVRKTNSVQSLPSPPPAIPLPPLPGAANGVSEAKDNAGSQRVEEQEARIRTIEKHLFAEKQLTATLEEALTDIEKDGKKVKSELDGWKKKCWDYEDELTVLRKERSNNRDSLQAIEAEKAGRLRAERAREALEERMAVLNGKKKKKSALNCF